MKPDICFVDSSGRPVLIADAKWKLLESGGAKLGGVAGLSVSDAGICQQICGQYLDVDLPNPTAIRGCVPPKYS